MAPDGPLKWLPMFDAITDWDNLWLAYRKAARGKRRKRQRSGLRASGRRPADRAAARTAREDLPARRVLPLLHPRAEAAQDQRGAVPRPRGAPRAVQPDRAAVRGALHRPQLRQPRRQGHAPRARSPAGLGAALSLRAARGCRAAFSFAGSRASCAPRSRGRSATRTCSGWSTRSSPAAIGVLADEYDAGLLPRRRPARRLPAARPAHRQSDLAVLVERLPERLRLVRPARTGLRRPTCATWTTSRCSATASASCGLGSRPSSPAWRTSG